MKKITIPFLLGLLATIIAAFIINNISLKGAQLGGQGISKESTFKATLNPDSYYWEIFPYSLLMGLIAGLVIFIVAYALTPKSSNINSAPPKSNEAE